MKSLRLALIAFLVVLAGLFVQPQQEAQATFHLMRIHAVMGGFNGVDTIQYVELRMCSSGQDLVSGHTIRFYDASNPTPVLKATFTFPGNVATDSLGDSILIATAEYQANHIGPGPGGSGGNADFVFSDGTVPGWPANTIGSNGGDPLHPVQFTGGKVVFALNESTGCTGGDPPDSIAYGGAVPDYGLAAVALPSPSDNRALRESNLSGPSGNSNDYSLQATAAAPKTVGSGSLSTDLDTPRNNAGQVAQLTLDTDQDGVADASDNCMSTANAFQGDMDGDGAGDACDPDSDGDTIPNASDDDDDNDGVFDVDEGECRDDVDSADANTLVNDGCPAVGAAESNCTNARDDDLDGFVNDGCPGSSEFVACGGDPLSPSRRPERVDGAFAATDEDGDGLPAEALPAGSGGFDCDGDGWKGNQENLIYLDAPSTVRDQDPCGNNGWPSELSGNDNVLNIGDVGSFVLPTRPAGDEGDSPSPFNMFNHQLDDDGDSVIESAEDPGAPGGLTYNVARWNLLNPPHTATEKINIGDLGALINGGVGSPARPPMFGGLQAFFTNGGMCPWPP